MIKRSKSIQRTIQEAEKYFNRFPDQQQKPKRQRQNKINQNQVQQHNGSQISEINTNKEKKQEKLNNKTLGTTQKTLDQYFQKKQQFDINIQPKVQDNVELPKVDQDEQKQQEQIDVNQILMNDQFTKVIQQNDKNQEQQLDLTNNKGLSDWWKSIFHKGNMDGPCSNQKHSFSSFPKTKRENQNIEEQKTLEKEQKIKKLPKLVDFFRNQQPKMNQITNQSKSNEKLNLIQVNNKDQSSKQKQADIKLYPQTKKKQDSGLNHKEYAKPQNNIQNEQNLTQSQQIIISQVPECEFGMVDCVFVVDTTGSMDPYLERTTEAVEMIVNKIKQQSLEEQVSVKFGLVCYRDHPPQELTYVTEVHDLCSRSEMISIIKQADCYGGGDGAEAALDGLNEAVKKISWRDSSTLPSLRYIFHICDQPPHGKEFGGYSELWEDGCPCGLKPEVVVNRINRNEIHYRLIMANGQMLQRFAQYLRGKIYNYDDTTLDVAIGMEIRISDMVIRELCPYTQQE